MSSGNVFKDLPEPSDREHFFTLLQSGNVRIERIVSNGQASPKDLWYDQSECEWVLLLQGTATLEFANGRMLELTAGDYLLIHSHEKHRVERTSLDAIWLTLWPGEP